MITGMVNAPLSASQTGRCEAFAPETRAALSSPILICLSRPRKAVSCLTASRCGRLLRHTRGADIAGGRRWDAQGCFRGFRGLRFRKCPLFHLSTAVACSLAFGISTTLTIGALCYILLIPVALALGYGKAYLHPSR